MDFSAACRVCSGVYTDSAAVSGWCRGNQGNVPAHAVNHPGPPNRFVPLVVPLEAGLEPMVALRRLRGWSRSVLLHSPAGAGGPAGRYSFLAADPVVWFELDSPAEAFPLPGDPFGRRAAMEKLAAVEAALERWSTHSIPGLPPFQGGWIGCCSYELGGLFERLPWPISDPLRIPLAVFGLYDFVLAWDHGAGLSWLICQGVPANSAAERMARARQRCDAVLECLAGSGNAVPESADSGGGSGSPPGPLDGLPEGFPCLTEAAPPTGLAGDGGMSVSRLYSNLDRAGHLRAIERCVGLIRNGDIFQANLAQHLFCPAAAGSLELFESLCRVNPAPHAAWMDWGRFQVASASPERLFAVQNGRIETRPIKGTRPRSSDPVMDAAAARELQASRKDRAENTMIVDLMRNDLSRICHDDSVRVTQWCGLESFSSVHHLVSAVEGRLREGVGLPQVLAALFPGGSVTGAPRIRAMEVIAGLEQTARGAYCGALGYWGLDGSADFSLLIRTVTATRGWWQFPVGGGIVADSDPEQEHAETWHKAAGLLRAMAALEIVPE